MSAVLQMVQQNHDQAEEGHSRLRGDFRSHDRRLETLETCVRTLTADLVEIKLKASELGQKAESPVDVGKIVFNPRMVLAIVGLVASIITGNWLTNQPIREQLIRNDERTSNMATEIAALKQDLKAGLELRRMEIATLQKSVDDKLRAK